MHTKSDSDHNTIQYFWDYPFPREIGKHLIYHECGGGGKSGKKSARQIKHSSRSRYDPSTIV